MIPATQTSTDAGGAVGNGFLAEILATLTFPGNRPFIYASRQTDPAAGEKSPDVQAAA